MGSLFIDNRYFKEGMLVIHNQRYDNLLLKYNVFDQNLVLLYKDHLGTQMAFLPPINFISEFGLYGRVFKKYNFANEVEKIYQEVYSGEIKCLYALKKGRVDSHHNIQFSAYKYYDYVRKSYLAINDSIFKYKGKRDFIKLFPSENKKEISVFIKKQKIKVNRSPDIEIVKLMTFCEGLISNK